ncbi:Mg2+ transporter protein CorA-like/Zinc transport protein ZntB [Penicillium chermesinum]|nr:Mg2+ transporter protein CorA-like/Zinc transport protein ZntB [Penicillium chermesinum]
MEEPQPEVHDVAQQDAAGDTASANGEAGAGDVRAIADESDPPTEHLEDESEAVDTEDRDAASDEEEAASANGDSDSDGTDSTASEEVAPKDWKEQLEYEIKAGALDKVEAILDNEDNEGALEIRFEYQFRNISKPTEGVTPLILAATLGHTEIVKLLMKRGADIRATTTTYSYTAFALAAHEGQLEVVKAILEHRKAELEDDEKPEDILECRAGNDETPLIFASWYGRGPVVDYLISEGADVTAKDNDNNTGLHHAAWEGSIDPTTSLLNADPSIVDWRNDSEETAFLLTARNGALAVAEFLLEKGASLTARDIGESTILHLSAWYGHLDMVKKFLAVRSQFLEERDKSGRTPFLRACWEGHVDVVAYLIEQGADMLVKAQGGETAFQAATAEGHLQVVKKLYDSHPEFLDMKRDDGQTALILAAWTWHLDIVKYLMDQKADIHAKDAEGDNILNNVVFPENGKPETVLETLEYLLDKGARLDSNNTGRNAFQIAAYAGKEDVVKLFLDALSKDPDSDGGPMPSHYYTAKDTWGDTALTDAASKDHISVVLAILESIIFIPRLLPSTTLIFAMKKK